MSTPKPTIFFVHGAWHQSAHFQPICKKLEADGFPAVAPTQPSYGRSGSDLKTMTMHDDANFIKAELTKLVDEGRQIVVVLHSYGGVVGTQAVDASLGFAQRAAEGKKGGVLRIVYMAAFMLPPEASLGDAFGGALPPFIRTEDDGSCNMIDPRTMFYQKLDDATSQKWFALTKPHIAQCQLTRLTYTSYLHHPLAYIVTTEDPALPLEHQRGMIAGSQANGLTIEVHDIAADHSPYLCKEAETISILKAIATRDAKA